MDHLLKEILVESSDLLFQIGDMIHYRGENPPVAFPQGLIQRIEQLRGLVLEPSFGKGHELHRRPAFNQPGDHGTRRGPIDVTDHPAQADAGIIEAIIGVVFFLLISKLVGGPLQLVMLDELLSRLFPHSDLPSGWGMFGSMNSGYTGKTGLL